MDESGSWLRFVLAVLATWRVTHLLASEDGPADLVVRFRARLGQRLIGRLMDCFLCLSLWIAAPAALYVSVKPTDRFVAWLAISGAACLLERLGGVAASLEQVKQIDVAEGGIEDVLWSETAGVAGHSADGKVGGSAGRVKEFVE